MNKEIKINFQSKGSNIVGLLGIPDVTPCPIVVMFHGGTNDKITCPMFDIMVPELNKAGIATFRFDFYGSGESDGLFKEKTLEIMDQNTIDALSLVKEDPRFNKIGLFGRSMSGGQVLYCDDKDIQARVIHSGSITHFDNFRKFYPVETKDFEENLEKQVIPITTDPREVNGDYAYSRQILEEFQEVPARVEKNIGKLNNICIFQGDKDPEVSVEEAIRIYNSVQKPKELHVMSGVGHVYEGLEKEVAFLTVSWFKRVLIDK